MSLFRNCCVIAAAGTIACISVRPAAAAPGPVIPGVGGPSAITAGIYLPNDSNTKDGGGSTQFSGEFRYTLPVPNPLDVPARTVASLGVEFGTSSGKHSTIVPLTVGEVISSKGSPVGAGNFFYGAGLGAYFLNRSGFSTATRFGGYGELGYNFTSALFLDAKYQIVQHADGLNLNVGLRF